MERTSERLEVRREVAIAASPETVWGFLVDPEKAITWWGRPTSFEVRPGGAFRMEVGSGNITSGEFLEVDPPRRLVCTWGWEVGGAGPDVVPAGSTTIELSLVPDGEGTKLTLVHRDLPGREAADGHGAGWDHYLGRLAIAAGGGDPGADPWAKPRD
jgi:uncharacterized protein YndB with AHSA1/START domain